MVGRLVEQQHVRSLGEHPGEREPPGLTAREARCRSGGLQTEARERGFRFVPRGAAARRVVEQRAALDPGFLLDQADARARLQETVAAVRLDQAGEQPKQCRLAGPVAPDQAGVGARLERQVDAIEQHHRPIGQLHVAQRNQGRPSAQ